MRNFLLGVLITLLLSASIAYGITRGDLYIQFGPMTLEAIVLVIKDEINILRAREGLSERTNAQLLTAVENKLAGLSDYDWMSE